MIVEVTPVIMFALIFTATVVGYVVGAWHLQTCRKMMSDRVNMRTHTIKSLSRTIIKYQQELTILQKELTKKKQEMLNGS